MQMLELRRKISQEQMEIRELERKDEKREALGRKGGGERKKRV